MAKLVELKYRASRSIDFDSVAVEATVTLEEGEKASDVHKTLVRTVEALVDEDAEFVKNRHAKEREAQKALEAATLPPKTVEEAEQIIADVDGKQVLLKDATVSQLKALAADQTNVRLSTAARLILGYPDAVPADKPEQAVPQTAKPRGADSAAADSGSHDRVPDWVKMDNGDEPRAFSQCTKNELNFIIDSNKVKRDPTRWGWAKARAEAELRTRG